MTRNKCGCQRPSCKTCCPANFQKKALPPPKPPPEPRVVCVDQNYQATNEDGTVIGRTELIVTLPPDPAVGQEITIVAGPSVVIVFGGANQIPVAGELNALPLEPGNAIELVFNCDGTWSVVNYKFGVNFFTTVPTWFIDTCERSKHELGTQPNRPLQTFAEWQRRVGNFSILDPTGGILTINILSDLPQSDPITFRNIMAAGTVALIVGQLRPIRSGVFTAVTNKDRANNVPFQVTDPTSNWSAEIGRLIITDSGARSWVARDLGGGTAHVSTWMTSFLVTGVPIPTAPPVPGEGYTVSDFVHVTLSDMFVGYDPSEFVAPLGIQHGGLLLSNLHVQGIEPPFQPADGLRAAPGFPRIISTPQTLSGFNECVIDPPIEVAGGGTGYLSLNVCYRGQITQTGGPQLAIFGGLFRPFVTGAFPGAIRLLSGIIFADGDPTFVGEISNGQAADFQAFGTFVSTGSMSFWDTNHSFVISNACEVVFEMFSPIFGEFGQVPLWGNGNFGLIVMSPGGALTFNEFAFAPGTPQLPSIVLGNGPGGTVAIMNETDIFPDQANVFDVPSGTYSPAIPITWANFLVPAPAGFQVQNLVLPGFSRQVAVATGAMVNNEIIWIGTQVV
jgi:hypothetical protein